MSISSRSAAVKAAVDEADAMRTVNHATLRSDDPVVPGAHDVLAKLVIAAGRYPQATSNSIESC